MADAEGKSEASEAEHGESHSDSNKSIDLQKLADRVYQLMVRDLRLEIFRSGRSR